MNNKNSIINFLWIFIPLTVAVFVWMKYYKLETFISTSDTQEIINIYNSVLKRNPTNEEIVKHTRALDKNDYNMEDISLRLYNSDEYNRIVKIQSNQLIPETSRILKEKDVIDYVKKVYFFVFKKKPEKEILLPLKDLFIHFDYDEYKLYALFRHTLYKEFEEDFKRTKNLTKQRLIEMYLEKFDDAKLTQDAIVLRKEGKLTAIGKVSSVSGIDSGSGANITLSDTDTNKLLAYLMSKGLYLTEAEKKEAAKELTAETDTELECTDKGGLVGKMGTSTETSITSKRVYLTPDSKIVKTGYGFSVPQKHPPVCIPVGEKQNVNPVVIGEFSGTPIEDAQNTSVGSIMPKFEYAEYIEIPSE